jgi:hypothetical protein
MLVCFPIDGEKLRNFFTKDQGLACMSGTKKFRNPCSLERTTLNASSALAAALFLKATNAELSMGIQRK